MPKNLSWVLTAIANQLLYVRASAQHELGIVAKKCAPYVSALKAGKHVHLVVCIADAEDKDGASPMGAMLNVRTSRHGRSKWTNVPLSIPDGAYRAVLVPVIRRKSRKD